ncbi:MULTISPECIES: hypothetical protein [Actinosynnema]|uniref:hypothetical protein n=1 Tax=Actinosynnema TaxID=40566 RepID=UPI0020A3F4CF|nr:hypothetical protein [Actinosynnema pretiosum]MCP2097880.1 hypothetical protein [Actinosynnema pretiosum]
MNTEENAEVNVEENPAGFVLNIGLHPRAVDGPGRPRDLMPHVTAEQVQAGLDAAGAELAGMGLRFDTCLLDRAPGGEERVRDALLAQDYDVIVFGGGVRLDPAMTPLFEKLVDVARVHAPGAALCFNTGPDTTIDAVRRWWPRG